MKKFTIIMIGMLTLLSCSNPFVNNILPDKSVNGVPVIVEPPKEPEPPVVNPSDPDAITINIALSDNVAGDIVTAAPSTAKAGDEITLSYNVAGTKLNNRLVFSGTKTAIAQADGAGSGTRKYTVDKTDSTEGVITIHAMFSHSDKEFDNIAFADRNNESKVYGSGNFTKAITNNGSGSGAISYASSDPTVATVNNATGEVTILKVGNTDITATKAADAEFEHAEAVYTLTVTHLQLTIANPVIETVKTYDGLIRAEITSVGDLDNKVGDDAVTVSAAANFALKNVGERQITVVYTISGADAGNYVKPVDYKVNGTINKLQLTVTESVTTSKPYDGNTTAAVSITSSNKISTDTLTITPVGTYNAATVAGAEHITVSYTISGADSGNYDKPDNHAVPATITKAAGSAVSVPKTASKTDTGITVRAVTLTSPNLGQTAEYAKSASANPVPVSGWQDGHIFDGLTKGSTWYIFARSKADGNCDAGTAQVSAAIIVMDDSYRNTVIDFETDTIGKTYSYTSGDNNPSKVAVAVDPANSGQKSLQITTGGNGWNQAAIIPVYLPYPLSNYDSFSFRFRLLSVGSDTNPKTIQVYAASDTTTFKRYSFGNPSSNTNNNFAANLVGSAPAVPVLFDNSYKDKWTEYEITITNPGNAIKDLVGNIYIAIGMNCNDVRDYLLDDLTFLMKDTFSPPPYISPTSATFDLKSGTPANADIPVTVALQGNTLTGITSSGTTFTTANYTESGNTVTLKKEYLADQTEGATITFTFSFSDSSTKTFLVSIINSASLFLKYDFNTMSSLPTNYPKYGFNNAESTASASGLSAVLATSSASSGEYSGKKILKVVKTTGHSSPRFILSFNVGPGNLSSYTKIVLNIRPVSGDLNNSKTWYARSGFSGTSFGSVGTSLGGTLNTNPTTVTIPISGSGTGVIDIGFEVNNTAAFEYEILSIELQ